MPNVSTAFADLRTAAEAHHDASEARAIAFAALEDAFGLDRTAVFVGKDKQFSRDEALLLRQICTALRQGQPIQYAVGRALWAGHYFRVTPATLIPRPETEGLLHLAIAALEGLPRAATVLDLGTGSGCLATMLALWTQQHRRSAEDTACVTAWDISEAALAVARENGRAMGVSVQWERRDMLRAAHEAAQQSPQYDLMVSNPPYVCEHERSTMARHVLDYEPATALFVPDDDPLRFYRALVTLAQHTLRRGGTIAVECNSALVEETAALFPPADFTSITTHDDCFGLPRFVVATRA